MLECGRLGPARCWNRVCGARKASKSAAISAFLALTRKRGRKVPLKVGRAPLGSVSGLFCISAPMSRKTCQGRIGDGSQKP